MKHSFIQLNDLPDEILMMILKKLTNIEVLYSLIGTNKRLNQIIYDFTFTNHLTLMISLSNGFTYPLSDPILDQFCSQILPKIHHKIKWLDLESSSMKRILLTTNYSNLTGLGLYNIHEETLKNLFTDENHFTHIFKNQILSLIIDINTNGQQNISEDMIPIIFTYIFTTFTNLEYLKFNSSSIACPRLSFYIPSSFINSSNLLELHVNLEYFTECLYLCDGRFNRLHTLYVNILRIQSSNLIINNTEKLPKLKYFSLSCNNDIYDYDELILPLLHRMLNLIKLYLYLLICNRETFIDGNEMKINIINHMPYLNTFIFNIYSYIYFNDQINLLSNEDIQKTFKNFKYNKIISCVDYFPKVEIGQCHIYSYPYQLEHYDAITNNFSGGLFTCVRRILLFDERSFEHEFFIQISQSFPFLEKLTVVNQKQQNNKSFRTSKNVNQNLSIIHYPHLNELDLTAVHIDYIKQFLFDTKTCLPNNVFLLIDYQLMKKVTRNFRRNTTRSNCNKLNTILFYRKLTFPEHFKDYFLHTNIL
ncbi:unnamed protein product [Rotaria sordida]|uniref:F-box domain-containing protein n=1 Tax=Rotaria sordida TaxID=392033 RepID=A0A818U3K5_9BILA|nr:unnamed protein product [Rotaria sordida]CAF3692412.1 unnamed protein product [Rotaria sordida]